MYDGCSTKCDVTIGNSTTVVEMETEVEDIFMEKVKTFTAFKIATLSTHTGLLSWYP